MGEHKIRNLFKERCCNVDCKYQNTYLSICVKDITKTCDLHMESYQEWYIDKFVKPRLLEKFKGLKFNGDDK